MDYSVKNRYFESNRELTIMQGKIEKHHINIRCSRHGKKLELRAGKYEGYDFTGVNFSYAILSGVTFSDCTFTRCDFSGATLHALFITCKFKECYTRTDDAEGICYMSSTFSKCELLNNSWYSVHFSTPQFVNCKIYDDYVHKCFGKTYFKNTVLHGVMSMSSNLSDLVIRGSDIENCSITDTKLFHSNITATSMVKSTLLRCQLDYSAIEDCNASSETHDDASTFSATSFKEVRIRRCNFSKADFANCDATYLDAKIFYLCDSTMQRNNFSFSRFLDSDFNNTVFDNDNFNEVIFEKCNLHKCYGFNSTFLNTKFDTCSTDGFIAPSSHIQSQCPQEGSFIGYKRLQDNCVVTLQVPEYAGRGVVNNSWKLKAQRAMVLKIEKFHVEEGGKMLPVIEEDKVIASQYSHQGVLYNVGGFVNAEGWNCIGNDGIEEPIDLFLNKNDAILLW